MMGDADTTVQVGYFQFNSCGLFFLKCHIYFLTINKTTPRKIDYRPSLGVKVALHFLHFREAKYFMQANFVIFRVLRQRHVIVVHDSNSLKVTFCNQICLVSTCPLQKLIKYNTSNVLKKSVFT